jgi:hypothetical protein
VTQLHRVDGKTVSFWDKEPPQPDWRSGLGLLVAAFIAGLVFGFIFGAGQPSRQAPATTPQPSSAGAQRSSVPAPSPTAAGQVGVTDTSPEPTGAVGSVAEGRHGIIAYATIGGPGYLAIPIGPGHLVKICGPAACWTTVSTDAGPNHERLLAGRIADVAVGQWERICGRSRTRGTCVGTWQTVDVPLPATDR